MQNAPVIQIAGALDWAEAEMLAAAGADFLGLPLRLLDGREDLGEADAAGIVQRLATRYPQCAVVAITYRCQAEEILDLAATIRCAWVQLHGDISAEETGRLKQLKPGLRLIKSLVVREGNLDALQEETAAFAPLVEAFITDTFDPATGRRGATGLTHDWNVSRQLVEISPKPVILAGGLDETNVAESIRAVRPAGVDAHTGLELPDGRKCPEKVRAFLAHAREAFTQLG